MPLPDALPPSREHVLLICTVGGTPEPIVACLKHWRPDRMLLIPSTGTQRLIEEQVLPAAADAGLLVSPGSYEVHPVDDAQDLTHCVRRIRVLRDEISRWTARGTDFTVVVDLTGGTKCLTAAAALCAQRWSCRFSYIGGEERTRSGVGTVVSGAEHAYLSSNPRDALGYQAVEDATHFINRGNFAAASELLDTTCKRTTDQKTRRELATLSSFAKTYAAWDRFDHKDALKCLRDVRKNSNDFLSLFGQSVAQPLLDELDRHAELLEALIASTAPGVAVVIDVLANAQRRSREHRFDDAVARLYRAIEAFAQIRLRETFQLETDRIALDALPLPLRKRWERTAEDGRLKLGLQQDYQLLHHFGDPLGIRFKQLELGSVKSPLSARNASILAHGFQPIGRNVFNNLWTTALALAELSESDLPRFPRLGTEV